MSSHVGDKLKLVRTSLGLTQAQFCDLLGIGIGGYKKYEIGLSEPGYPVIEKFANHESTKMYMLWLLTDNTNPSLGQISPGDKLTVSAGELSDDEFETQFVEIVSQAILMFCHLNWFTPNTQKPVDFDDCGKLILKDLKPLLSSKYSGKQETSKTA
ncbi:helix-turn-helix domain-containing protein [Pseudoalteromonas sp. T1lg65]|uniref:helix-turn-helix domain-containing protein n=1 Tax=Pseudoalteromonas sp. T1lg65 TaxID=2077101 RepID=UPI003F7944F9